MSPVLPITAASSLILAIPCAFKYLRAIFARDVQKAARWSMALSVLCIITMLIDALSGWWLGTGILMLGIIVTILLPIPPAVIVRRTTDISAAIRILSELLENPADAWPMLSLAGMLAGDDGRLVPVCGAGSQGGTVWVVWKRDQDRWLIGKTSPSRPIGNHGK